MVAVLTAMAALLGACADSAGSPPAAEARKASFAEPEVTWAQGRTLHYGPRQFDLGPGVVKRLWRTSYGFIYLHAEDGSMDAPSIYRFFDGARSTPLPGEPSSVAVSPDGRYAGWIDIQGTPAMPDHVRREAADENDDGPAEAVVVDLRTGRVVMRNRDDMGDRGEDLADLYEDGDLRFGGFDEKYAYWAAPDAKFPWRRAEIGTRDTETASRITSHPGDSLTGQSAGTIDDPEVPTRGGLAGFRSQNRRWCVTTGQVGRLWVDDCRTRRDTTPSYPTRAVFFGGWQGDDRLYVLTRRNWRLNPVSVTPDRTSGVIASCTLPAGRCRSIVTVKRTYTVVFATGVPAYGSL